MSYVYYRVLPRPNGTTPNKLCCLGRYDSIPTSLQISSLRVSHFRISSPMIHDATELLSDKIKNAVEKSHCPMLCRVDDDGVVQAWLET